MHKRSGETDCLVATASSGEHSIQYMSLTFYYIYICSPLYFPLGLSFIIHFKLAWLSTILKAVCMDTMFFNFEKMAFWWCDFLWAGNLYAFHKDFIFYIDCPQAMARMRDYFQSQMRNTAQVLDRTRHFRRGTHFQSDQWHPPPTPISL